MEFNKSDLKDPEPEEKEPSEEKEAYEEEEQYEEEQYDKEIKEENNLFINKNQRESLKNREGFKLQNAPTYEMAEDNLIKRKPLLLKDQQVSLYPLQQKQRSEDGTLEDKYLQLKKAVKDFDESNIDISLNKANSLSDIIAIQLAIIKETRDSGEEFVKMKTNSWVKIMEKTVEITKRQERTQEESFERIRNEISDLRRNFFGEESNGKRFYPEISQQQNQYYEKPSKQQKFENDNSSKMKKNVDRMSFSNNPLAAQNKPINMAPQKEKYEFVNYQNTDITKLSFSNVLLVPYQKKINELIASPEDEIEEYEIGSIMKFYARSKESSSMKFLDLIINILCPQLLNGWVEEFYSPVKTLLNLRTIKKYYILRKLFYATQIPFEPKDLWPSISKGINRVLMIPEGDSGLIKEIIKLALKTLLELPVELHRYTTKVNANNFTFSQFGQDLIRLLEPVMRDLASSEPGSIEEIVGIAKNFIYKGTISFQRVVDNRLNLNSKYMTMIRSNGMMSKLILETFKGEWRNDFIGEPTMKTMV